MKTRIILCALVMIIGISSVRANEVGNVNEKALTSFQKDFRHATDVNWQSTPKFLKVSFTLNGQVYMAYYNEDGDRLAIARNITSNELPMGLQADLKDSYPGFWISDLFEIHGKEEAAYYVTIENADYRITLKSTGLSEWITYKRSEKN